MSVEKPDVEGPAGIESILLTGAESAQPQPDWDFGLFGGPRDRAVAGEPESLSPTAGQVPRLVQPKAENHFQK